MIDEFLIGLTSPATPSPTRDPHREILLPSPLPRPPRWREGTRPPACWVINSPFVSSKACQVDFGSLAAAPRLPRSADCALPRARGPRSERARHMVARPRDGLCAARPPGCPGEAAAIVPRRGGRCSDSGSKPASSPECPHV